MQHVFANLVSVLILIGHRFPVTGYLILSSRGTVLTLVSRSALAEICKSQECCLFSVHSNLYLLTHILISHWSCCWTVSTVSLTDNWTYANDSGFCALFLIWPVVELITLFSVCTVSDEIYKSFLKLFTTNNPSNLHWPNDFNEHTIPSVGLQVLSHMLMPNNS